MQILRYNAVLTSVLTCAAVAFAGNGGKEFRYAVGPGCLVTIANETGNITVTPAQGGQVIVSALPSCEDAEVHANQTGKRIEIHTWGSQNGSGDACRVDYDLQVPADSTLTIRSGGGAVSIDHLQGDITVDAETARVDIHDVNGGHISLHSISGPIALANVRRTFVDITSVGGDINLTSVTGPKVTVNTSMGAIRYRGDFGTGGNYSLMNHSGLIEVVLPDSASVDLNARSIKGPVENDFPFQPKQPHSSAPLLGHSFSGTSNSGASSVRLSSFTGTIRVKKQ
jgi:DUF4097 and DUF4098 domain-containing protein YvlB